MSVAWGVVGPGSIARSFARAVQQDGGGRVHAVASRSLERADAFADEFGAPVRLVGAEALAADPDVQAVYVASPHAQHLADALPALEAGKHVLCEKPMTLSAQQSQRLVDAARSSGVFLMEAVWSRFLPAYAWLADTLASGRLGEPLLVEADFGYRWPTVDPAHRLFDLAQGGGALLDLGIYPLQLASLVLGHPDRVLATAHLGETGVDEQIGVLLHHPGGALAVLKAAVRTSLTCTARIAFSEGQVQLPAFMHCPDHLVVSSAAGQERVDCSWEGEGLRPQVAHVHACLEQGLTESPVMPLDETLALARTMDDARAQIGLRYPGEESGASRPTV